MLKCISKNVCQKIISKVHRMNDEEKQRQYVYNCSCLLCTDFVKLKFKYLITFLYT